MLKMLDSSPELKAAGLPSCNGKQYCSSGAKQGRLDFEPKNHIRQVCASPCSMVQGEADKTETGDRSGVVMSIDHLS